MSAGIGIFAIFCAVAAAGPAVAQPSTIDTIKPEAKACPEGVAQGSRCLTGRDSAGPYYWLAVPPEWKGTLLVHAHGGPAPGEPKAERAAADLTRWSIWTRAGYAYHDSSICNPSTTTVHRKAGNHVHEHRPASPRDPCDAG
jgi:hypothetical protein